MSNSKTVKNGLIPAVVQMMITWFVNNGCNFKSRSRGGRGSHPPPPVGIHFFLFIVNSTVLEGPVWRPSLEFQKGGARPLRPPPPESASVNELAYCCYRDPPGVFRTVTVSLRVWEIYFLWWDIGHGMWLVVCQISSTWWAQRRYRVFFAPTEEFQTHNSAPLILIWCFSMASNRDNLSDDVFLSCLSLRQPAWWCFLSYLSL